MKRLFITHDTSVYGAARSLGGLLKSMDDAVDVLTTSGAQRLSAAQLAERFGARANVIGRRLLPLDPCYRGAPPRRASIKRDVLVPVLWECSRRCFYRFLRRRADDVIHLNSLTLHRVVRADLPFIIHVREIAAGPLAAVRRSLEAARGVVFIDEATRAPFGDARLQAWTVLHNPFDMRSVSNVSTATARADLGLPADAVVFAMIGMVSPEKGNDFVIDAFLRAQNPHARLLMVGSGQPSFVKHCQAMAAADTRVIFAQETPLVDPIYAALDYVLRGEAYACVGRTTYEGLYAGASVVVPGLAADRCTYPDQQQFGSRIHLYPPRDQPALTRAFEILRRPERGVPGSNSVEYVDRFDAFLRQAARLQ